MMIGCYKMSQHELIDVLNETGEVIDTISRGQAESENQITNNVLVFVFNSVGQVWTQLRPQSKSYYPGKWDISACGGVLSGETKDEAAQRETMEEMRLDVKLTHVESFLNVFQGDNDTTIKKMSHLYVGMSDELPTTNAEVDEFKCWQISELRQDATAQPDAYVPSFVVELDKALAHTAILMIKKN